MAFSIKSFIKTFFGNILGFWSHDIGIDLGTANTLVFVRDKGIVLREPSVVAVYTTSRRVRAVGNEAKRMLGRTPGSITTLRPMKDGVIADFEVTEAMLRYFIGKVSKNMRLVPPRVIIAVPSGITEVEKRAVKEAAVRSGARDVLLIQEPVAAAIGVGLPIDKPAANMIVDIGGNGVVFSRSTRIGGDEMDRNIVNYVKKAYNLVIGDRTAEELKIRIGSADKLEEEIDLTVKGRDAIIGLPKTITVSSTEVREALSDSVLSIVNVIRSALEQCPPELSADLVDRGIVLAGGGSMIRKLDALISRETGLPVVVANDPLSAVANGTGTVLQDLSVWFDNE